MTSREMEFLLMRTQSTLRLIELATVEQQQQLKHVAVGLGPIERILIAVIEAPNADFETAFISEITESLSVALTAIDEIV